MSHPAGSSRWWLAVLALGFSNACAPAASPPAPTSAPPAAQAAPTSAPPAAQAAPTTAPPAGQPTGAPAAQATPAAAASTPQVLAAGAPPEQAAASCTGPLRKITLGVAVAPPNVVHTSPFVARALGFFAKRCIDANIVQFEGGLSQTNLTAVAQGAAMGPLNESAIGSGVKGKQVGGMAPKLPQADMVGEQI